jgi:hypothetical protein
MSAVIDLINICRYCGSGKSRSTWAGARMRSFVDDSPATRVVARPVLSVADVQMPGETDAIGERRRRERSGAPPLARYDEILPRDYWDPAARRDRLASLGVDEAICFPNYGLVWERTLQADLSALAANMAAWNRWCETVAREGQGRLHPVATSAAISAGSTHSSRTCRRRACARR